MKQEKISRKTIGAVTATGILAFCGVLISTAMNVIFPALSAEFQVDIAVIQWLTTIYFLVLAIIVPLSGFLKQSFKNKTLFLAAIGLFIAGIILNAFASSFALLLIGRVVQGIGTGIALPLMFNIILEQVPSGKLGMMMGVGTMIPAIAPAIGPTFGGWIVTRFGWRAIFIFLLPVLIGALLLGALTIEQKMKPQKAKLDLMGTILVAGFFIGMTFGFSYMGSRSFFSLAIGGAFLLGAVCLCLLLLHVRKHASPVLKLRLLKNKAYTLRLVCFFIMQLVLMGLVFILPLYLQLVNQSTAQTAGLIILPGASLGALFTPLGGRFLDRYGEKRPIVGGSLLIFSALMLFWLLAENLGNVMIGLLYFLFTLGIGFSFGNLMTSALAQLEKVEQAAGNALIMTVQQFAAAAGTAIIAAIMAKSQSNPALSNSAAVVEGSKHSFVVLLLLFTGVLLLLGQMYLMKNEQQPASLAKNQAEETRG